MDIILRETGLETIPYKRDKRIREWCFGSFDGGYDGEFFMVCCREQLLFKVRIYMM